MEKSDINLVELMFGEDGIAYEPGATLGCLKEYSRLKKHTRKIRVGATVWSVHRSVLCTFPPSPYLLATADTL